MTPSDESWDGHSDQELLRDLKFHRDMYQAREQELARRAEARLEERLGKEGAKQFREATSKALNDPTTVRKLFKVSEAPSPLNPGVYIGEPEPPPACHCEHCRVEADRRAQPLWGEPVDPRD